MRVLDWLTFGSPSLQSRIPSLARRGRAARPADGALLDGAVKPRGGGQAGQAMLELAIVLPVFLLVLLSVVQVAEIFSARLATGWAARLAARAAAVHVADDPDRMAERAAIRVLSPFLPRLVGTGASSPLATALDYVATAALYENAGEVWGRPIVTRLTFAFAGGNGVGVEKALPRIQAGEGASAEVQIDFDFPLRIPFAKRFFADAGKPGQRRLQASARFPVMNQGEDAP